MRKRVYDVVFYLSQKKVTSVRARGINEAEATVTAVGSLLPPIPHFNRVTVKVSADQTEGKPYIHWCNTDRVPGEATPA